MAMAAGSQRSWWVLAGLGGLAWFGACDGTGGDSGGLDLPLGDLLADVGPEVMVPGLAAVAGGLGALSEALDGWQAGTATQADAQAAWSAVMVAWQALEVAQVGPAGDPVTVIGGEALRDELYSWPTVNGCRIDQETVEAAWDAPDFTETNLVNSYGLDALEHLLFAGLENSCPSQTGIDADWDALGDAGEVASRQAYAVALAAEATGVVALLQDRWSPSGGDFGTLLTATTDASPYTSPTQALDQVFAALFYLDTAVKDRKLAQPLGLRDCAEAACPEDVEGLLSGTGTAHIAANLAGFRTLFTGGEGSGFDDLLDAVGHSDLGAAVLTATDAAIATAATLDGPLDTLITSDPDAVTALHTAIKAITDLLKGDLVTVLALTVPADADGDND